MYIAYLDESGVVEAAGTNHFVLVAVAIPAEAWKTKDASLHEIKTRHRVPGKEIHTAWLLRRYPEQERVPGFAAMTDFDRRVAVEGQRKVDLAKAALRGDKAIKELAKNYRKTADYIHMSHVERKSLVAEFADEIGRWSDALLFGDAQEKPAHAWGDRERIREFAFEQVVTRFQTFLSSTRGSDRMGMLVHDQNQTACSNLTTLMRAFHKKGTAYAQIPNIIETPLFVDSSLTSMVQAADLVGYATRRFFEKGETALFDRVYSRFDRRGTQLVGLRHFTGSRPCSCRVCLDHGRT